MSMSNGIVDLEAIAREKSEESLASVRAASAKKVVARRNVLERELPDAEALRRRAAQLRQQVLDSLPSYLEQAEISLKANGINVHWADTPEDARQIIGEIAKNRDADLIIKSKSMVTEEIELNTYLESLDFNPVESDLGEFVVQIMGDHPSHIVTPIIHINGRMVARIFEENGLGEYTESPEELTAQARRHFRDLFRSASMGITGANFVVAETGRLVTVSNEGNLRFSANAPRTHVAITGIEKIVATEAELAIILKLLARSATGQSITVYTQFFAGARKNGELDGPDESHLVFLNNGRTNLLGGEYREMLRCIRCGACLNVCPVYRAVSGHGYGSVYPGPMGAIFSPLLGGEESRKEYAWLPKASSLCGACEEVCPVSIPIPKMLIGLRHDLKDGAPPPKGTPGFGAWAKLANSPMLWRTSMKGGSTIGWGPAKLFPAGPFKAWLVNHDLPPWPKRDFRSWWKKRGSAKPKTNKLGGNHG